MNYIYKITNNTNTYVGSTNNFKRRKYEHKKIWYNPNSVNYNFKVYKCIRTNGGWDNFTMEIVETTEKTGEDLLDLEKYYIKELNADLNTNSPLRTKEELIFYNKNYYEENKEEILEKSKQYRQNSKDYQMEYQKKYRAEHVIDRIEKGKIKYKENIDKIKEYRQTKIECSNCGIMVCRGGMARHKKTEKCLSYIKNNI